MRDYYQWATHRVAWTLTVNRPYIAFFIGIFSDNSRSWRSVSAVSVYATYATYATLGASVLK